MSFQARIRRLASETAVYGVSSIVGRLINFLLFPLYSHVFLPSEYDPIVLIYAAFMFLNILYQHGMESSYLKFATDRNELSGRSRAFGTAVISLGGLSVLLSTVMYFAKTPTGLLIGLDESNLYLLNFAALILLLDALSVVPFADLRLRNKPWVCAGIRIANIVVNVGLNLVFIFVLDMGILSILLANVAASGLSLLLLIPTIQSRFARVDSGLWKKMILFGLPFVPGGIGYAMTERINLFFLAEMDPDIVIRLYDMTPQSHPDLYALAAEQGPMVFTQHIVGTYGGMIKLAVLMALFVQMFRYAWQPFFLQRQKDHDAPELFGKVFAVLTLILTSAYLGISFFAEEIVRFPVPGNRTLIASSYWMGLSIIPVALIGYVFQGWYYHFSAGAYIKNQSKYFLHATAMGSITALVINAWFVPTGGMIAAAAATSAAYAVMAIVLFFLIRPHYPLPYNWVRTIGVILLAGGTFWFWSAQATLQVWWAELGIVIGYALIASTLLGIPVTRVRSLLGQRASSE